MRTTVLEPGGTEHSGGKRKPAARMPKKAGEIIIVDDDTAFRDPLVFGLESQGHTVTVFDNGPTALDAALALPAAKHRRLMMLAVDLPGMSGHALHTQLNAERPNGFIVVFLSPRAGEADALRAVRDGALDYIVKPLSIPLLLAKVDLWIKLFSGR